MMDLKNKINIAVLSDFSNFNNNIDKIFAILKVKSVSYTFIDSLDKIGNIIDSNKYDLLIINKSAYSIEDVECISKYEYGGLGVIVVIDSYFKFELFFENINKGIITIRRPITVNKFVEVIKVALISHDKKNNDNIHDVRIIDFAKVLLIIYKKLTEDEAHKYLERYAMELRINIKKAAQHTIAYYLKEMENIKYEYKD